MIDKRSRNNNTKKSTFTLGKFLSSSFGNLTIILIAIISGVALGFLFFYLSMYVQAKRASVVLPNYVNMDSQRAEQELKKRGFRVVIIGEHGRVIKMDPSPSISVKVGREVKLFTENVKTAKLVLPDFKHCWYKSVELVMRELNINTSIKEVAGPGMYGTIVSSSPSPGNEIISFQNLILFINSGKDSPQNAQQTVTGTETSSSLDETGTVTTGAVEVVPPTVDLNNNKTEIKTTLQEQETSTSSTDGQTIEGGQF